MSEQHYKPAPDYTSLDAIERDNHHAAHDQASRERDSLAGELPPFWKLMSEDEKRDWCDPLTSVLTRRAIRSKYQKKAARMSAEDLATLHKHGFDVANSEHLPPVYASDANDLPSDCEPSRDPADDDGPCPRFFAALAAVPKSEPDMSVIDANCRTLPNGDCIGEGCMHDIPERLEPAEVFSALEGTKDSNPKDAVGVTKTPFSTVSAPVLSELGLAMLEGALKYGRHNYRFAGVRASVYYDAVFRHMTRWFEGEDIDPDTIVRDEVTGEVTFAGISHLTKAMAGLAVIRDAMIQDKFIDDRPPQSPPGWQDAINAGVRAFNTKYPEPVAPYLSNGRRGAGRVLEKT